MSAKGYFKIYYKTSHNLSYKSYGELTNTTATKTCSGVLGAIINRAFPNPFFQLNACPINNKGKELNILHYKTDVKFYVVVFTKTWYTNSNVYFVISDYKFVLNPLQKLEELQCW